ncbi:hypothetical protein [Streptomyces capitiformicae]|uniref:Uncharacterized protein n=1 Tax=Streptomyces capitiformicae TaxID=2014920 RepID=A0A918ZRM8_9ACTN|nr:hypothetical protein [Streptomyces capitiformicae]GHE67260.1 hypothetical protein GCM10017771_90920 [Streptomyces capitiformicae]
MPKRRRVTNENRGTLLGAPYGETGDELVADRWTGRPPRGAVRATAASRAVVARLALSRNCATCASSSGRCPGPDRLR